VLGGRVDIVSVVVSVFVSVFVSVVVSWYQRSVSNRVNSLGGRTSSPVVASVGAPRNQFNRLKAMRESQEILNGLSSLLFPFLPFSSLFFPFLPFSSLFFSSVVQTSRRNRRRPPVTTLAVPSSRGNRAGK
jgi:NADH:ubiquinone oxidoreductase subunit H